ncbi:hypothetical protein [uncultured Mucilaginibacter sp.]|uniref:hypothetical protein n=1 Tax=uncultured Mucilaginibacter sp. TaxID=797541 RepID=UPI0025EDD1A5|nr:hypothetical protein [uncultured Mucilaginibacter sp.]
MIKFITVILLSLSTLTLSSSKPDGTTYPDKVSVFKGSFTDDYGIKYTINDTLWIQHPRTKFHIIKWNYKEQYLIARNDAKNPGEGGLYTRIDLMQFDNMQPWLWGYCLSVFDATSNVAAEAVAIADRKNPRKGCNGYPFSRMKRVE